MNKLEEDHAAADKCVRTCEAADLKIVEANRAAMTEAYSAIVEGETNRHAQRRADFAEGKY